MTCPANFSSFYTAVMVGPGPLRSVLHCGRVMATTLNKWRVILLLSPGVWFVSSCSSLRPKRQIVAFPPCRKRPQTRRTDLTQTSKWTWLSGQSKHLDKRVGADVAKWTANKRNKGGIGGGQRNESTDQRAWSTGSSTPCSLVSF